MIQSKSKFLVFREENQYIKICIDDLLFLSESEKRTNLIGENFEYKIPYTVQEIYLKLPKGTFYWAHPQFLVNITKVDQIATFHLNIKAHQIPVLPKLKTLIMNKLCLV